MSRSDSALRYEIRRSPIGDLFLLEANRGPAGVLFLGPWTEAENIAWAIDRYPDLDLSREACPKLAPLLDRYFAGEDVRVEPPLWLAGSAFEHAVWREIATIPFGRTLSYGEIARRLVRVGAARAVGLATGRNPLAILVPCHRVLGRDGRLTGYGGGLARKRWLLAHERGGLFPHAPMG